MSDHRCVRGQYPWSWKPSLPHGARLPNPLIFRFRYRTRGCAPRGTIPDPPVGFGTIDPFHRSTHKFQRGSSNTTSLPSQKILRGSSPVRSHFYPIRHTFWSNHQSTSIDQVWGRIYTRVPRSRNLQKITRSRHTHHLQQKAHYRYRELMENPNNAVLPPENWNYFS